MHFASAFRGESGFCRSLRLNFAREGSGIAFALESFAPLTRAKAGRARTERHIERFLMINENIAKGKWNELKGNIQKAWGNLTSDELDKTEGDMTRIAGILQQKYGFGQEEARKKLNDVIARFGSNNIDESTKH
jgi:uncharacterized protein YjbJ (UPF0337 family)